MNISESSRIRLFSFLKRDICSVVPLKRTQLKKIQKFAGERVGDVLLKLTPEKYEKRVLLTDVSKMSPDERITCAGRVSAWKKGQGRRPSTMVVELSGGRIHCVFFGKVAFSYMRTFPEGSEVLVSGKVRPSSIIPSFAHPEIYRYDEKWKKLLSGIVPVYPSIKGVSALFMLRTAAEILRRLNEIEGDWIPVSLTGKMKYEDFTTSLIRTHFPEISTDISLLNSFRTSFHRRMARDRIFFFHYGLELNKKESRVEKRRKIKTGGSLSKTMEKELPFSLTDAQKRSLKEIRKDLSSPYPMNRLLQGDVGSGKTLVMLFASLDVVQSGYSAVIMAPTEILAEQHLKTIQKFLPAEVSVSILKGGMSGKKKKRSLEDVGEADIIVGTHALYENLDKMKKLGLVIIDEQHRFGVAQRMELMNKAENPDVLIVSATPIPRSLSLTLYGGVDISVINEMPPGRKPVTTRYVSAFNRNKVIDYVVEIAKKKNRKGYWICPLVEESESIQLRDVNSVYEELRKLCGDRVALLHGRMKNSEKNKIIENLREGSTNILVSTIVVEVGVDIPDASFMVVENAERFGLAQLHQLRGRVGRSDIKSFAAFIAGESIGEKAENRLEFMVGNRDGFRIAEFDLKQRGPGALTGLDQSGFKNDPVFILTARYGEEVQKAKDMVEKISLLSEDEKKWIHLIYSEFFSEDVRRYGVG